MSDRHVLRETLLGEVTFEQKYGGEAGKGTAGGKAESRMAFGAPVDGRGLGSALKKLQGQILVQ